MIPAGATSGPIEVTSPSGTGVSPFTFAVPVTTGSPTITSFTPSSALVGATITINGTNFDPSNLNDRVSFNGGPDVVPVAATATALSVVIPQAGPGRVTVRTPRGVAVSGTDFALDTDDLDGKPVGGLWRLVVGQPLAFTLPFGTEAVFLVDLEAGQRVDAKLTDVTPTQNGVTCNNSPNFAGLTFRLPDGRLSLELFSSDCNYVRPFVAPVTGTYSFLVFDDFHATDVNATITIHEPVDEPGTTVINQGSRVMTIAVPGQKVRWTFQAVAGEPLHLSVGEYPLCGAIDVSIYAPDDSRIVGMSPCWSDQATVTAPATGTYVLQAESFSGATGNAGVTLSSP